MDAEARMTKSVELTTADLRGLRTGRASGGLVENIRVGYYGTPTPIKTLASIAVPEPQMIVIKPFDPSIGHDIVKAIQRAGAGLNPQTDGKTIRVPVPPLSEENRGILMRSSRDIGERGKAALRNIRRDANRGLDEKQKDGEITEDECRRGKAEIQKMLGTFEAAIGEAVNTTNEQLEAH